MRVLQLICSTGFYGAERWILALAKHLPKDKVQCDLATTLEANSKDLEIVKQYREMGLEAFEIPMSNRFDLGVIGKLVELIKQRNIDVIHTHGYKSDILGILAARKAKIRCVVTPHGFENASDLKLRAFIWLGNQAMKYADVVVPLSPALMEDVKKIGVPDKKVQYIQNGVDLSEVEAQDAERNQVLKSKKNKRIGFIGQMISRKNIFDILDIFQNIAERHDDVELVLLGDGDQRPQLEEYSQSLSNKDRIHFLGFRDDRLDYLQSLDLFVMTSTLEGIPRCLMEATAMGIPVAAYDIAGIDQLIEHEKTGLLAPLGEKNLLTQYWEELLYNPEKAAKISEAAKEYVYEHYSGKRMAMEYLSLFEELVKDEGVR